VFKCLGRWRHPGLGPWSTGGPWAGTKMMIITNQIPMNTNITQKFSFLLALKKNVIGPWPWLPHPLILRPGHITIDKITDIITITRQKPAYGRQGLAAVSLRASGAQLGRGKWSFFVTDTQTHTHFINNNKNQTLSSAPDTGQLGMCTGWARSSRDPPGDLALAGNEG